jgi:hypothetical protein
MNESIFKSNPSCETQSDYSICHLIMEKTVKFQSNGFNFMIFLHYGLYKHNRINFYRNKFTIIQI